MKKALNILMLLIPLFSFSQNKLGITSNYGIGNSNIKIDNIVSNGNSSTFSLQGDYMYKNGLVLTPRISYIEINYQSFFNNSINFNEMLNIKYELAIGQFFAINKSKESTIWFLPRVGFYYRNFNKIKSYDTNGNASTVHNIGGTFGFNTQLSLFVQFSKSIYSEVYFLRSFDLNNVNFLNNQSLKIKDDKTIGISIGFLF